MQADLIKPLSERAFRQIQGLFRQESGILLSAAKQALVTSRLRKRLEHLGLHSFDAYCDLIDSDAGAEERRLMVDILTTNETYFFREPQHFQHLANTVLPSFKGRSLRLWCAAASSGEEPYSLAMTLDDKLGGANWSILGTDLCRDALAKATRGLYSGERLQNMPLDYLKRYCLRGTGAYNGKLLVQKSLRQRLSFEEYNLLHSPARLGQFDVIFMRNVLIYFEQDMKRKIVGQALNALKPDGWLYVGHSESLHSLGLPIKAVSTSIYRKVGAAC